MRRQCKPVRVPLVVFMAREPWLDEWLESVAEGQANMNPSDWQPFNVWKFEPFFGDEWVDLWLWAALEAEKGKVDFKALAHSVVLSLWRKEFRFLMRSAKIWGYSKADMMKLARFLKKLLETAATGDYYGLRYNFAHSAKEVKAILDLPLVEPYPALSSAVGLLSASCPALSWGLYTDFYYSNSYELFGLYDASAKFGKGSSLMVKKFGPFRCPGLWPQTKNFQNNNLTVYAVYKDLQGHFDIINHFVSKDSMPRKLTHFLVVADGKMVESESDLLRLAEYFSRAAAVQWKRTSSLSFEQAKKKTLEAKYYQYNEFFSLLGRDWRPSKKVYARIKGRPLAPFEFPNFAGRLAKKAYWKKLIDPRIDLKASEKTRWANWIRSLK